jgi:hypothetical protein
MNVVMVAEFILLEIGGFIVSAIHKTATTIAVKYSSSVTRLSIIKYSKKNSY